MHLIVSVHTAFICAMRRLRRRFEPAGSGQRRIRAGAARRGRGRPAHRELGDPQQQDRRAVQRRPRPAEGPRRAVSRRSRVARPRSSSPSCCRWSCCCLLAVVQVALIARDEILVVHAAREAVREAAVSARAGAARRSAEAGSGLSGPRLAGACRAAGRPRWTGSSGRQLSCADRRAPWWARSCQMSGFRPGPL